MKRELRSVYNEAVSGALIVADDGTPTFHGGAGYVISRLIREFGEKEAARRVMADGWSNGYVYFAEPTP